MDELIKETEDQNTISIAVTGTTTSGKSTVVNLLCGHEIMPVSAGEMSAGVVTINHNPEKRILRVLETPNAMWECGEWDNLTDDEIRKRLTDVMKRYNEKRGASDEPSCPQIELEFPIRIGLNSDYIGISENYKLQIMDLPCFKFIGDEVNESLCLVTYNSEETDVKKQDELLNEVVSQVKILGGSPARMLFVLNRIDAFRREMNWKENENEFVNKITAKIKEKLSGAIPEYEKEINNLKIIKLSSLPAYLSLAIRNGNKDAAKRIDFFHRSLIPDEILDELPRKVEKWSEQDMYRVADAVWHSSYGKEFEDTLKDYIKYGGEMSLEQIFQFKKGQAELFVENWKKIKEQIIESFGNERIPIIEAAEALDKANCEAYKKLVEKLDHPTVSIATTGTTSSGKSTVVNLLCGHEIMPVSAGEMSAGVVTIYHHPDKRTLRVLETPNAAWECGEWDNLTDDDIRNRLTDVMKKYNEKRGASDEPPCPQIELEFPIRIGLNSDYIGIPKNYKFQVLDLPGFKFIGDEGNMSVIRRCRESLCLVTYNSEDTDEKKQNELLNEVVSQVKSLSGSPARMLFVLNRIDAFRRDDNLSTTWQDCEKEFVNKTTLKIKEILSESLPEYKADIKNLKVIKLSSLPAYLSLVAEEGNKEEQQAAARRIDRDFNRLIPENILDVLPRRVEAWKEHDMKQVSDSVQNTSYGKDFQESLKQHIQNHLPALVIPQIIEGFKQDITTKKADDQDCVEWSRQIIKAEMKSSKEKYEEERQRLEQIKEKLKKQQEESAKNLLEPFDRITKIIKEPSSSEKMFTEAREALREIDDDSDSFAPLHQWMDILAQTASDFLQEIAQALDSGKQIEGKIFDSLPYETKKSLNRACGNLTELKYHEKQGKHIETIYDNEKMQLRRLNEALNKLGPAISIATSEVIKRAAEQEKKRIYNVINRISQRHIEKTWEEARKIAPDIGFDVPPPIKLDRAERDLKFDYKFASGFDLKTVTRSDFVRNEKIDKGKKKVKIGEERAWYFLWLGKKDVYTEYDAYEYKPIYEQRTYGLADIPDADALMGNWGKQLFSNEPRVLKEFSEWLTEQINKLKDMVEKAQQKLVENYKKKLEDARENTKKGHEVEIERLDAIKKDVERYLNTVFSELIDSERSSKQT